MQDAIDYISKQPALDGSNVKMTIIMIAHRLQTIATVQNLLYIENKNTMLAGAKDTQEYNEIMHKLKEESYKH